MGLNIDHRLISIGGRENHDKELFNGTGAKVGLRIWSGLDESGSDSGERCDWLVLTRIKGILVQRIDPINSP